jgi:hypothetical protein
MSIGSKLGTPDVDCVDEPKNSCERNRASPRATTLITTPETMWSTRNVTVATAWTSEKTSPDSAPTRSPITGPHSIEAQAPITVPVIIRPSSPMLTIPDRSLNSPPRPVR